LRQGENAGGEQDAAHHLQCLRQRWNLAELAPSHLQDPYPGAFPHADLALLQPQRCAPWDDLTSATSVYINMYVFTDDIILLLINAVSPSHDAARWDD
jgi:hypothetical protein